MIGRGCLKNPRIFQQARGMSSDSALRAVLSRLREHLEGFYDERLTLLQMRKFASWYSAGYPGAAQLRRDLFALQERGEVLDRIDQFYLGVEGWAQEDTSREAFSWAATAEAA